MNNSQASFSVKSLKLINQLLTQDKKTSTYKFALLRAIAEISLESSPQVILQNGNAHIPRALLVEKWLFYYYPIFENKKGQFQISGNGNLAFADSLISLINYYQPQGGFDSFNRDYQRDKIPEDIQPILEQLEKKVNEIIWKQPCKHLGYSISNKHYSIIEKSNISPDFLNNSERKIRFGFVQMDTALFESLGFLGTLISGAGSILNSWAQFTVKASRKSISFSEAFETVNILPNYERNISISKSIFDKLKKTKGLYCVWSGEKLSNYAMDHLIPFSLWGNNNLWNLMPTKAKVNSDKSNFIPSPDRLARAGERLIHNWQLIKQHEENLFLLEVERNLVGHALKSNWEEQCLTSLTNTCEHLITNRGLKAW
jgi:hypothetical protein